MKTAGDTTLMQVNTDAGSLLRGTFGAGAIPASGPGSRLMWHPKKAAFRAGFVDGAQWDEANVGFYSGALGHSSRASGYASMAMGHNARASGTNALATGSNTLASGFLSTAMGNETTASGAYATTLGRSTTAQSFRAAFGLGSDERSIATVDADGVLMLGVQALEARTRRAEAHVATLQAELAALRVTLETAVACLPTSVAAHRR